MTLLICPHCKQSFIDDYAEHLDSGDEICTYCPTCNTPVAISVELVREYFVSLRREKDTGGQP